MIAFAAAIFSSAFLLFQVQPIIARFILPWFGGGPAVWTACMLFFQVGLLCGYSYAHMLARHIAVKHQPKIHLGLLLLSFLLLPIAPSSAWAAAAASAPALTIIQLLSATVGLPFILISATAPLLQHWFSRTFPGQSPFRLYALSNLGSLVALLSYPVLVEPHLPLASQTSVWSFGYVFFALLCLGAALPILRGAPATQNQPPALSHVPSWTARLLWVLLAACGSTVLLAMTNQMTQDVSVVPFLWVLPLSLYLLSFIICFDRESWYHRGLWLPLLLLCTALLVYLLHQDYAATEMLLSYQIAIYSAAVFSCCMVCHGELVRRKSAASQLTTFYLYVALGGALGGVFVNVFCPLVFTGYWELHLSLVGTFLLAAVCILGDKKALTKQTYKVSGGLGFAVVLILLIHQLSIHIQTQREFSIANKRNFYGVLHVYDEAKGTRKYKRSFYHGRIEHGAQWLGLGKRFEGAPTTYFGPNSGIGRVFRHNPKRRGKPDQWQALKVGVIGLGVGTVAAHGRGQDTFRFYEINPQVEELAREYFTYLNLRPEFTEVVLGDGRISLEQELQQQGSQQFDILLADAFSGDSIPTHLLTKEAIELYWKHLRDDGFLALNITNFHFDLRDVARQLARQVGKQALLFEDIGDSFGGSYNLWVIITDNAAFLQSQRVRLATAPWPTANPKPIYWTDNFSNLFEVIYWQ